MNGFRAMFTDEQWTTKGASVSVSDEIAVTVAHIFAGSFAQRFKWRDGAADLLHAVWESVARSRSRGLAARLWHRAANYHMIDFYRELTDWRKLGRVPHAQFADSSDQLTGPPTTETRIPARRIAPRSVAEVLEDYEPELRTLDYREIEIVRGLIHGDRIEQIATRMGLSQSRVSQLLTGVLARFGGRYNRGEISQQGYLARPRTQGSRRDALERKNKIPAGGVDTGDITD